MLGLSPLVAGAWTVPGALGFVAGAMLTPQLVKRVRAPFVVCGGLLVAAAGFTLLTRLDGELALLVTGCVIVSLGLAAVFTLATDLMVGTAPPERAGAASAIAETGAEFGGALGIAVLGLIGTAVYRSEVPAGVDTLGEVSDPAAAGDRARRLHPEPAGRRGHQRRGRARRRGRRPEPASATARTAT